MNQFHDNLTSTDQGEVPNDHSADSVVEALAKLGASAVTVAQLPQERITLVAVHTRTGSPLQAETVINQIMWQAIEDRPEVVAHWIAMDGRYDNTDEDSAVFVRKGMQDKVQEALVAMGFSDPHNLPPTGG